MLVIKRTTSEDADFSALVKKLDLDLNKRYGEIQAQYNPLNKVDNIKNVVVAYANDVPAGCGCFKKFDDNSIEMKRVFVDEVHRNKGIAALLMKELENWARQEGYTLSILETGTKQYEAISLYKKLGYSLTENFPPYEGMEYSVCYRKSL